VAVLPSGCVISHHMLDIQMSLYITDNAVGLCCKNTAYSNVFLKVVHWHYQSVLYFLNAIWCRGKCEWNFVHPYKKITSFPSPTLTKLTSAQQHRCSLYWILLSSVKQWWEYGWKLSCALNLCTVSFALNCAKLTYTK